MIKHRYHILMVTLMVTSLMLWQVAGLTKVDQRDDVFDLHYTGTDLTIDTSSSPSVYAFEDLNQRLQLFPNDYEARLLKGLLYIQRGKLDTAYQEMHELVKRAPKFHLAQLVHADLLMSRASTVSDIGSAPLLARLPKKKQQRLSELRAEATVRLNAYLSQLEGSLLPSELLLLGPSIKNAVVVDKTRQRLYIYQNQGVGKPLKLMRDFYVTTGQTSGNKALRGDLKTPEGVYFITRYIPDAKLPDKYGNGAFPINYPNAFDKHLGRTGDGIWLHGTGTEHYSRPPKNSEGCVVLTNMELDILDKYMEPGTTPVVLTETISWISEREWSARRLELMTVLDRWLADWESNDVERYLSNYHADFWSGKLNLRSWSNRKRRVNRGKTYQNIDLKDVSLFSYPSTASQGKSIVVASFQQLYRSNNYSGDVRKQLYIVREKGSWKILYEGRQ
ncbi:MAG: murein L,D-transpeptidase [Gammaproteobacteria bacterium]|nr:MAG: murein L,D-transpeptidase [Gammaproteobacteria bacterium]